MFGLTRGCWLVHRKFHFFNNSFHLLGSMQQNLEFLSRSCLELIKKRNIETHFGNRVW